MNISAKILRNIVAASFKVDAREVILSGEISADWTECTNTCWSYWTTEETHKIWGFNPIKGFVELTGGCVRKGHNRNDGFWINLNSPEFVGELGQIKNVEEYSFFLHHGVGNAYEDRQSWNDWVLYKAPSIPGAL